MQILRVSPYNLSVVLGVSAASTEYSYTITDLSDSSSLSLSVNSNSDSQVEIPLSAEFDTSYLIEIDGEEAEVEVVRPYVDPNTQADSAADIATYRKNEEMARAVIDSIITEGFYYKKHVLQTSGLGADYLPLWSNAKKILKVYENSVLIYDAANPDNYDRAFEITKDKTAITETATGLKNRLEGAAVQLPAAGSDWLDVKYEFKGFPKTFDYTIIFEEGYRNVPSDIQRATELLVEDISCGRLDYFKRYITQYDNDQFKIKIDDRTFEGTGNIVVDKILSKYAKGIRTLGVL
jgi:hypothetical protein